MDQYDKIVNIDIEEEMRKCYIDYAMSVIVARALPDVRDGLKPVQRRILFSMGEMNLDPSKPYKKSARIVGDVMGKYHPHGDSSIYQAMVRLAQNFSMRYMLVDGHGNFGSIDGDGAAASRYTEARMSRIAVELLADIDKNTVDFIPNYDENEKEPTVLPSRIPNLLINGSNGIAVGMATNIPPHNLGEVIDGVVKLIDDKIEDKETDVEDLLDIIKGPDFPTGAKILGRSGIRAAYRTGRGKIVMRSTAEIETADNGRERIVISEIPYQVNKARLVEKIADLVKEKRIEGISDLLDESAGDDIRIVVDIKRDANANVVLNQLYKYSSLQESFGVIMLALVDGKPKVLNLKEMLDEYLKFQFEVVTRRTKFDLEKAERRAHILEGYRIALDNIDEVIKIIRESYDDGKENLMKRFGFSEIQAQSILDMQLKRLQGLEHEKIDNEYNELMAKIKYFNALLADDKLLYGVIKDEITAIGTKYADPRRTEIINNPGEIDIEDLIEDEMSVITLTNLNYIKRLPLDTYKSQNRGGRGIIGMQTREEDFVKDIFLSSTHDNLMFFTSNGRVYKTKCYEIPEAGRTARGTSVVNMLEINNGEKITSIIPYTDFSEGMNLVMITKHGVIKKTDMSGYANIRRGGIHAINLNEGDELISVFITDGTKDIFIATNHGMGIRFNENDARPMGRTATGVRGIKLRGDDYVVGAQIIDDECMVLNVTEKGYGKRTNADEFKVQLRGGTGVKIQNVTEKTGKLIGISIVKGKEELMLITSEGIIIRIRTNEISNIGRVSQGVKLMNLTEGVNVVSIAKIDEEYIEEEIEEAKVTENVTEEAEITEE
ncbi:MAG: DNA gyrase subunit A [Lachnospiraceae bacterium]|nr:DNA gyrase subunit A [Lachnospiraceae bacterium]